MYFTQDFTYQFFNLIYKQHKKRAIFKRKTARFFIVKFGVRINSYQVFYLLYAMVPHLGLPP